MSRLFEEYIYVCHDLIRMVVVFRSYRRLINYCPVFLYNLKDDRRRRILNGWHAQQVPVNELSRRVEIFGDDCRSASLRNSLVSCIKRFKQYHLVTVTCEVKYSD